MNPLTDMAFKLETPSKAITKKEADTIEKALDLMNGLLQNENRVEMFQQQIDKQKDMLKKLLRKLPHKKIVDPFYGHGFELQEYKKTEIKNEVSAQAWGLENPQARMKVQIAKVTVAFEGKPMPKWATRIHAEKLMPIKPRQNPAHETE